MEWDPMITTPPGLYLTTILILKLCGFGCSLGSLRIINAMFAMGIFLVSRQIVIMKGRDDLCVNIRALMITLLPNLFPYFGLYYTDPGSLFFCLLSYYTILKLLEEEAVGRGIRSGRLKFGLYTIFSLISLVFRQTNIIWVAIFFPFEAALIHHSVHVDKSKNLSKKKNMSTPLNIHMIKYFIISAFLITLFSIFVLFNGGSIALGDKQNHSVSLHLAQIFYCSTLFTLFFFPMVIVHLNALKRKKIIFALLLACSYIFIRLGTIEHPYLVNEDSFNPHWVSIIWKHFMSRSVCGIKVNILLVPIHAICSFLVLESIDEECFIWKVGFFVSCALVLIPTPLIEPRYFITPMTILLLNIKIKKPKNKLILIWQLSLLIIFNAFIIGMFLYKPVSVSVTMTRDPQNQNQNQNQIRRYIW